MKRRAVCPPLAISPGRLPCGFSVIAAIFLLVILSALGAFILSVSSIQHVSQGYDVLGIRAYQAARAGIEFGLYQVLQVPPPPAAAPACFGPTSIAPAGLGGFTVSVSCSSSSADELGTTVTVYQLTATACNRPAAGACPGASGEGYVERQITTMAAR
jgi:MSHA biogenesis protein MshP